MQTLAEVRWSDIADFVKTHYTLNNIIVIVWGRDVGAEMEEALQPLVAEYLDQIPVASVYKKE